MPQRGELHAIKILNDPNHLYHYLSSNIDAFFNSENFQKKYMYEVPKLLWVTEKLEDLGDFVLLFPNPARIGNPDSSFIKSDLIDEHFADIFDTVYTYQYKKKFMTALKDAFVKSFVGLNVLEEKKKVPGKVSSTVSKGIESLLPLGKSNPNTSPKNSNTL